MLPPCLATGFSANKPETIVDISSRSLWRKPEVPVNPEEYSNLWLPCLRATFVAF
jgi:hypothetical protein